MLNFSCWWGSRLDPAKATGAESFHTRFPVHTDPIMRTRYQYLPKMIRLQTNCPGEVRASGPRTASLWFLIGSDSSSP